jgi:hypothetical protein
MTAPGTPLSTPSDPVAGTKPRGRNSTRGRRSQVPGFGQRCQLPWRRAPFRSDARARSHWQSLGLSDDEVGIPESAAPWERDRKPRTLRFASPRCADRDAARGGAGYGVRGGSRSLPSMQEEVRLLRRPFGGRHREPPPRGAAREGRAAGPPLLRLLVPHEPLGRAMDPRAAPWRRDCAAVVDGLVGDPRPFPGAVGGRVSGLAAIPQRIPADRCAGRRRSTDASSGATCSVKPAGGPDFGREPPRRRRLVLAQATPRPSC